MTQKSIIENSNYYVIVGVTEENKIPHYLVINKKYDVIEAETSIYPQALKYAADLDAAIYALSDISKGNTFSDNNVKPFPKKD